MLNRLHIVSLSVLVLALSLHASMHDKPQPQRDFFAEYIEALQNQLTLQDGSTIAPGDGELRDWEVVLRLVRKDSLEPAARILARYHYTMTTMGDVQTGAAYLVIRENQPMSRNWGTFVFNRHAKKRLFIDVENPVKEANTLQIGADLFRHLGAEWLCIAGGATEKWGENPFRPTRTVYSRWHEMLVDLTHMTVSVQGYPSNAAPKDEIVLSNGRTTDEQWGISQISLSVRDSLRQSGFACSLAMYDSGYAALSGARNHSGIFSNDSVGFGHWLSLELSSSLRFNPTRVRRLIAIADRALELTGRKVSQQVNRAFGLVSPRVVRVDSLHRIMFPPSGGESYRILSFNGAESRPDTLNVHMGSWMELGGRNRSYSSIAPYDTGSSLLRPGSRSAVRRGARTAIVQRAGQELTSLSKFTTPDEGNDVHDGNEDATSAEPVTVHRIPIDKVPIAEYSPQAGHGVSPFSLGGILPADYRVGTAVFEMNPPPAEAAEEESASVFLVPLINCTSLAGDEEYIGVRMNSVLVGEIARLVATSRNPGRDVGLIAEEGSDGSYFLRILPAHIPHSISSVDLARKY